MPLYRLRKLLFTLIVSGSVILIGLILAEWISVYPVEAYSVHHATVVLTTLIGTTGAVGAIALAIVFITAQLSASKAYVLQELYRNIELYVLLLCFVLTLCLGYIGLLFLPENHPQFPGTRLLDIVFVLACTSVLLVVPALALQIENLSPVTLASKLSAHIKPSKIMDYGLTHVRSTPGDPTRIEYQLITVGLRPREADPFRPIHEVIMVPVLERDRVLFGKLFRHVLKPIADVYGAWWDLSGLQVGDCGRMPTFRRILAKRYSLEERVHLTLAILHYAVKRARNLLEEWEGRDTGRHGILTGIGDLARCLSGIPDAEVSIRLSLYAALHISEYYSAIKPFGRIEPLNSYFKTATCLLGAGKVREAELCAAVLGWIAARTSQLNHERSPGLQETWPVRLREVYSRSKVEARRDATWFPGIPEEDPWRAWLD